MMNSDWPKISVNKASDWTKTKFTLAVSVYYTSHAPMVDQSCNLEKSGPKYDPYGHHSQYRVNQNKIHVVSAANPPELIIISLATFLGLNVNHWQEKRPTRGQNTIVPLIQMYVGCLVGLYV